jgi:hypothetical protein
MTCVPRSWSAAALTAAALLILIPAAGAQVLRCKGDLVFEDALARAVVLFVDVDQGTITTRSCFKYPELRGFCAGDLIRARNHEFVFGSTVSKEDSRLRIELIRTNGALGTDTVLNRWPRATFLGRCTPVRVAGRRHGS